MENFSVFKEDKVKDYNELANLISYNLKYKGNSRTKSVSCDYSYRDKVLITIVKVSIPPYKSKVLEDIILFDLYDNVNFIAGKLQSIGVTNGSITSIIACIHRIKNNGSKYRQLKKSIS